MERVKKTYAKKGTLLRPALDIYECKGSVYKCKGSVNESKSEVKEVYKHFLYQKGEQARKFPPKFQ